MSLMEGMTFRQRAARLGIVCAVVVVGAYLLGTFLNYRRGIAIRNGLDLTRQLYGPSPLASAKALHEFRGHQANLGSPQSVVVEACYADMGGADPVRCEVLTRRKDKQYRESISISGGQVFSVQVRPRPQP